jgi:hypothetical protein
MIPPNDKTSRYVLYHLGGSFMNIICGVLTFILIHMLDYKHWSSYLAFLILSLSHFTIGLNAIIPVMMFGIPNDGMCVFKALQSKEARRGLYLIMYEYNHLIRGGRLREFDDTIFAVNETVDLNNYLIAHIVVSEARRLYDVLEYEKSIEQYERLNVKKLPVYLQSQVYNDLIYYYIVHKPDYEQAKKIFNDKKAKKYFNLRIICAYEYFVNGDKIKAVEYMKRIEEGITILSKRSDGNAIMEKEYLTHLLESIKKSIEQNKITQQTF